MRLRVSAVLLSAFLLSLLLPSTALAQRKLWGISGSFSPIWSTATFSKYLNGFDAMEMDGQTFRVGVSRGGVLQGDWSLLFLRRSIDPGGTIETDGTRYTTNNDVTLTGFEVEKFAVTNTFKDRVVLGVVVAGGVAVVQGTLTDDLGQIHDAKGVMTLVGTDIEIQPLFRLEFAVGFKVARGFRVRLSGGFDWSGYTGSLIATYFFGDR